jgi:WD40 repeat protein
VNAVAWSPDGTYLATSDSNGVIILWTRRGDESTSITIQAASSLAWSRTGLAVVFDLACSR